MAVDPLVARSEFLASNSGEKAPVINQAAKSPLADKLTGLSSRPREALQLLTTLPGQASGKVIEGREGAVAISQKVAGGIREGAANAKIAGSELAMKVGLKEDPAQGRLDAHTNEYNPVPKLGTETNTPNTTPSPESQLLISYNRLALDPAKLERSGINRADIARLQELIFAQRQNRLKPGEPDQLATLVGKLTRQIERGFSEDTVDTTANKEPVINSVETQTDIATIQPETMDAPQPKSEPLATNETNRNTGIRSSFSSGLGVAPNRTENTIPQPEANQDLLQDPVYLAMRARASRLGTQNAQQIQEAISGGNRSYNQDDIDRAWGRGNRTAVENFVAEDPQRAEKFSTVDPDVKAALEQYKIIQTQTSEAPTQASAPPATPEVVTSQAVDSPPATSANGSAASEAARLASPTPTTETAPVSPSISGSRTEASASPNGTAEQAPNPDQAPANRAEATDQTINIAQLQELQKQLESGSPLTEQQIEGLRNAFNSILEIYKKNKAENPEQKAAQINISKILLDIVLTLLKVSTTSLFSGAAPQQQQ